MSGVGEYLKTIWMVLNPTSYKNAIDANFAVLARLGDGFAPHQSQGAGSPSAPDMTVTTEAGFIKQGSTWVELAAQVSGVIVKPVSNPRRDLIHVDEITGTIGIAAGAEAASPADPALPEGKLLVGRIRLTTSTTAITDSIIDDLRLGAWHQGGDVKGSNVALASTLALPASGEYFSITDPGGSPQPNPTAISSRVAGREIELRMLVGCTFKTGAALVMQGGADLLVAPGDILRFRSEGSGNWRQTNYWPATPFQGVPWAAAAGTADALTASYVGSGLALADGLLLSARATAANATTTPTFKATLNGTVGTARTITKQGGAALAAGDIAGAGAELLLRYRASATRWELLNPATSAAGVVLIQAQTASNSAQIDFTSGIDGTYDAYLFDISGVQLATNLKDLIALCSTNGGSTFDAGANYQNITLNLNAAGGGTNQTSTGDTQINVTDGTGNTSNGAASAISGTLRLFNPSSSALYKLFKKQICYYNGSQLQNNEGAGIYLSATAVNAIRFKSSSGNITAGVFRLYGMRKS